MRRRCLLIVGVTLFLAACEADGKTPAPSPTRVRIAGTLTVFAAASLTEAFTELGDDFEAEHPNLQVTFNFAASSALAQQINEGASADVFASADEANMKKVTDAANAGGPVVVARNRLSILVEPGNPKRIARLADLATSDVVTVVCAPEVPCGRIAAAALAKAAVSLEPASLEENVKAVVAKVTLGEADAGLVYVTDVLAAGDKAEGIDIDVGSDPTLEAVYPMAVTVSAENPVAASAWLDFVRSGRGQRVLAAFGFLAP